MWHQSPEKRLKTIGRRYKRFQDIDEKKSPDSYKSNNNLDKRIIKLHRENGNKKNLLGRKFIARMHDCY